MFKIYDICGSNIVVPPEDDGASSDEDVAAPVDFKKVLKPASVPNTAGAAAPSEKQPQKSAKSEPSASKDHSAKRDRPAGLNINSPDLTQEQRVGIAVDAISKAAADKAKSDAAANAAGRRHKKTCCRSEVKVAADSHFPKCACTCGSCVDERLVHFKRQFPRSLAVANPKRRDAELGCPLDEETGLDDVCHCSACCRRRVNEYEKATGRSTAKDAQKTCKVCLCDSCATRRRKVREETYQDMCPCKTCNSDMDRFSKGWPVSRAHDWDDNCACGQCTIRRMAEHTVVVASLEQDKADELKKREEDERLAAKPTYSGLSGLAGALSKGGKGGDKSGAAAAAKKAADLKRDAAKEAKRRARERDSCLARMPALPGVSKAMMQQCAASASAVYQRDVALGAPLDYMQRWNAFETAEELGLVPQRLSGEEDILVWRQALEAMLPRVESARKRGNTLFTSGKLPLAFRSYWTVVHLLDAVQHMYWGDCLPDCALEPIADVFDTSAAALLSNCAHVATKLHMWDEAEFACRMCMAGWGHNFPKSMLRCAALFYEMGFMYAASSAAMEASAIADDMGVDTPQMNKAVDKIIDDAGDREGAERARLQTHTNFTSVGLWPKRDSVANALLCGTFQLVGITDSISVRQGLQRLRSALLLKDDALIASAEALLPNRLSVILYVCPDAGNLGVARCTLLPTFSDIADAFRMDETMLETYTDDEGLTVWSLPESLENDGNTYESDIFTAAAFYYHAIGTCGVSFADEQFAASADRFRSCIAEHTAGGHEWTTWGCTPWVCALDSPLQPHYGLRFDPQKRTKTAAKLALRAQEAPRSGGDALFAVYGFGSPSLEGTVAHTAGALTLLPACGEGDTFQPPKAALRPAASSSKGAAAGAGGSSSAPAKCPACAVDGALVEKWQSGNSGHSIAIKTTSADDQDIRIKLMKSSFMKEVMQLQMTDFPELT